ncbi:MAG: glycosyltransferase family 39 protein [Acetobacteraceae bacterium]|nr:glycosyltransferase family 39 protein [Acetobacteraceae bacterium]
MQRRAPWLRNGEFSWALTALIAAAVLITAAAQRSFEYDEAYTFFLTAGVPRPTWPTAPFLAGEMRGLFQAHASLPAIAAALRATDVHPPLYFWAIDIWRRALGGELLVARLFSVVCALAALLAVGRLARQARIPAVTAVLLTLGCYGFTYTGAVARGFALAQALSLWGAVAGCSARRRASPKYAAISGLLFGAATATNYLTAFVAAAGLGWLLLTPLREEGKAPANTIFCFAPAIAGFALFLPLDLRFFVAQHASRTGQFPPFAWVPGIIRLARCYAGALLGAIPRYFPPPTNVVLQAVLASLSGGARDRSRPSLAIDRYSRNAPSVYFRGDRARGRAPSPRIGLQQHPDRGALPRPCHPVLRPVARGRRAQAAPHRSRRRSSRVDCRPALPSTHHAACPNHGHHRGGLRLT